MADYCDPEVAGCYCRQKCLDPYTCSNALPKREGSFDRLWFTPAQGTVPGMLRSDDDERFTGARPELAAPYGDKP